MRWSESFLPTLREEPAETQSLSHRLSLKAGLVKMLASGIYSYLPLGFRVLRNIENIIRQQMQAIAAIEVLLPALQPLDLWIKSGRDAVLGQTMIRFIDRRGRKLCLGPTHEEVITDLVKGYLSSYKQLPIVLFQIQTKFRDELRPRSGLIRSCEFIMKDAYSFDKDDKGLDENYDNMYNSYLRIFERCGLKVIPLEADTGVMGGSASLEFMVPTESGEDKMFYCKNCRGFFPLHISGALCPKCKVPLEERNALEVGHVFKLGIKYTESLDAYFTDERGKRRPAVMGCYGIGVSRLVNAVIECNNDAKGIIWPLEVSPFSVVVSCLDISHEEIFKAAFTIYNRLKDIGIEVLFDDRKETAGVKLNDALLVGIPFIVIVGKKYPKDRSMEIEIRGRREKIIIKEERVAQHLTRLIKEKHI